MTQRLGIVGLLLLGLWVTPCWAQTGMIGQDFVNTDWTDGVWQGQFNANSIDGIWKYDYAPSKLGVGFYGNPPIGDATLEKYFSRPVTDPNVYDVVFTGTGARWHRYNIPLVIDYRLSSSGDWVEMASGNTGTSWDSLTLTGKYNMEPDDDYAQFRFRTLDVGNWSSSLSGGGSSMSYFGVDYKLLHMITPESPFHDDCDNSDLPFVYDVKGGVYSTHVFGGVYALYSNGGENHFQYGFYQPDLEMPPGTDPNSFDPNVPFSVADVRFDVYSEIANADEYCAFSYSLDGETWTELSRDETAGGSVESQGGSVVLPYKTKRFYVQAGGPTLSGGAAWLSYLLNIDVDVQPVLSQLGEDYARTTWDISAEDDFDKIQKTCDSLGDEVAFNYDYSWLGICWAGIPPTVPVIWEKRFYRPLSDDGAYNATVSVSGKGWHRSHNSLYLEYSLDGNTWYEIGQADLSPVYDVKTLTGTVGVGPQEDILFVRFWLPDAGDHIQLSGGSCGITAFSVDFEPASPADINGDFIINLADFAELANDWLWDAGDYHQP